MKITRFWGIAGVLGGVVLAAIVWLAPAAHGQTRQMKVTVHSDDGQAQAIEKEIQRATEEPTMRAFEILTGRGSQIGVAIKDLADADLEAGKAGVQVEEVRDSSPAAQAGVKAGDVFTAFDGERVRSARQFARLVEETPAGRSVKAQVLREGKTVDLTVTPSAGERSADRLQRRFEWQEKGEPAPGMRMTMPPMPELPDLPHDVFQPGENFDVRIFARPGRLGVNVQSLTPDLAEFFGVKDGGVLVTAVTKDSAAAKAGIKAGDVITSVDGKAVDDAGELRRQLPTDDSKNTEVSLGVIREKKSMTLKVPFEAAKPRQPAPGRRTV